MQKGKMVSEESLQIAEERREAKGKGQEKRYTHLNAEFKFALAHQKSKRIPEKTSTSVLLTTPKPLTVWITTNCGKFFKKWEYQTT